MAFAVPWHATNDPGVCFGRRHREENVIPVSAFYKGETRINHFAKLIIDNNPKVRLAFVECISRWTLNLLNRYDHEVSNSLVGSRPARAVTLCCSPDFYHTFLVG